MNKDPQAGRISRAYVFRCFNCSFSDCYEWNKTDRLLDTSTAQHYARQDKWKRTKNGWKCPHCEVK